MWRSRARLGLCAIFVALAWSAAPAARAAPADAGTWRVFPGTARASAATSLAFTYTAPVNPAQLVTVTVDVPGDWTATAPATVSCPKFACWVTADSGTQIVVKMASPRTFVLASPAEFVLDYPATAPGFATTDRFTATEQFGDSATPDPLAPLPVTVICPDGTGTMTVAPATVAAGSSQTLTFTYTAGSCGVGAGGLVAVTVPGGWTQPNTTAGQPGDATWAGGPVSVTGSTITVPVGNLAPGGQVTFAYEMPQAPGSPAGYTFAAAEQSGAEGSPQPLPASPLVAVTPGGGTTTTPAGGGTTTTPVGGGTTTTPVGGGTATTPVGGGTATTQGGGGTATTRGGGGTAHSAIDWPPIVLLVLGLVLAAGTTARLAFRGLRHGRGEETVTADVRAVPHTGPPATVVIRDTGRRPALTVRIEPHASATVTTIEETQP